MILVRIKLRKAVDNKNFKEEQINEKN